MPRRMVQVPVKTVSGEEWAELNAFGADHVICGEKCSIKDQNYSFAGGHRVRLYSIKKNVHWKLPAGAGTFLDVTAVPPAGPPPRRQVNR
jgi:hypothetical protein